jgi:DNA-directed RNA polymerase subunit RPC12/RpoP
MPQITDNFEEKEFEELIHDGIAAVKGGQRSLARTLLNKAIQIKSADARPWIWLTATTDDPEEQRQYFGNAVAAEPGNAMARRGLVLLSQKLDKSRLVDEGAAVEPRHPTDPEDAQSQSFACPRCGGRMSFDIHQEGLVCHYCGYIRATEQELAAESAEQPIDFVMPTTRAHRWAEAQQRVCCERCGAVTLLPPGQKADQCPYCGSNRLVGSAEAVELVDPQVIGLMKVDAQEAVQRVKGGWAKVYLPPMTWRCGLAGFISARHITRFGPSTAHWSSIGSARSTRGRASTPIGWHAAARTQNFSTTCWCPVCGHCHPRLWQRLSHLI